MALVELVDTLEQCQAAVAQLFKDKEVAIDIEGVDLSRAGEVCLIQMCSSSTPTVFLFDIVALGAKAFEEGGLKKLLEAEEVAKLFYDVRSDNDALYHLHGVHVHGAYDIQVLWHVKFANPSDVYLQGLKKVLAQYFEKVDVLTAKEAKEADKLKEKVQKLFVPELGGSYDVWKERPLRPELVEYAAVDAKFLLGMKNLWAPESEEDSSVLDSLVKEMSDTRLRKFIELPREQALNQSDKKFRDFEIPQGFNKTGDITEKVPVPPDKKGLIIGRGGATIKSIQASSGARVSLNDDCALVCGQPSQVGEAVRQIQAKLNERRR